MMYAVCCYIYYLRKTVNVNKKRPKKLNENKQIKQGGKAINFQLSNTKNKKKK